MYFNSLKKANMALVRLDENREKRKKRATYQRPRSTPPSHGPPEMFGLRSPAAAPK